jgi:hypothetical protein
MIRRLIFSLLLMFAAVPAFAQTGTSTPAQAAQKQLPPGFERVAGAPETEKVDANQLVIIAYIAFFVCMFGYVVFVARSQAAMAKEMAELDERIRRAEKK